MADPAAGNSRGAHTLHYPMHVNQEVEGDPASQSVGTYELVVNFIFEANGDVVSYFQARFLWFDFEPVSGTPLHGGILVIAWAMIDLTNT